MICTVVVHVHRCYCGIHRKEFFSVRVRGKEGGATDGIYDMRCVCVGILLDRPL